MQRAVAVRPADLLAGVAFAGYAWNVLAGKAEIVFAIDLPRVGDVAEFLLLLLAAAAFVSGTIQRERERFREPGRDEASGQGETA